MAENSGIEWTDHTVNLWWGCAKVHTGCKNCYAEHLSDVRYQNNLWGEKAGRKRIKSSFKDLDKYQKKAREENKLVKVFCGSMMDIFEDPKELINPTEMWSKTNHLRNELFTRIDRGDYDNLIFLFLTKRPQNIQVSIPGNWLEHPPKNVWFGTSLSDQDTADEYTRTLLSVVGNKFLSVEPQVGPINIEEHLFYGEIDWIIQGGESGSKKRPFDIEWARSMREQCDKSDTPYFFKQIDKIQPIPEDLNIKEFPKPMWNE